MPSPSALQHINVIGDGALPLTEVHDTPLGNANTVDPPIARSFPLRATNATLLGAGLPPIPAKLVSRIEAGEFLEMAELLPERLDPTRTLFTDEPELLKTQKCRKLVTNILEWTQCFAMYTAILCKKYPDKLPDMLSYLILI